MEEQELKKLLDELNNLAVGERIDVKGVTIQREPWCYKVVGEKGMRRIGLKLTTRSLALALRFVKEGHL